MRRRGRGNKPIRREEKYRINRQIDAPEVRLIDDEGKMLGVYAPADALRMAEDKGLDLIEIAPKAKPPTCKIMDYGKWKYEAKKKDKASKKKQTVITIKEIQVRPRTDDHDLNVKLRKARDFLLGGDKVKVNLRFSGREMAHQDLGYELLKKVCKLLDNISAVESPPKKEGRQLFVLLVPDAAKIKDYQKSEQAAKDKAEAEANAESDAAAEAAEAKTAETTVEATN